MNPFEAGVIAANGLYGVMSRVKAEKGSRTVQGRDYPFFYNPMWSLLGNESQDRAPGSYYYSGSGPAELFWHIFDQVLIRSDLLDSFSNSHLRIINSVGSTALVTETGLPDKKRASDHLPILFKLTL